VTHSRPALGKPQIFLMLLGGVSPGTPAGVAAFVGPCYPRAVSKPRCKFASPLRVDPPVRVKHSIFCFMQRLAGTPPHTGGPYQSIRYIDTAI